MYQPVRGFFHDILHTQYRAATDVYAFMFLADVVDFIIIIFGFWAFEEEELDPETKRLQLLLRVALFCLLPVG